MKIHRWGEYLLTIWIIVTLNFLLPRIMPGGPFLHVSADDGEDLANFSQAQRSYYQKQYQMDRPLYIQYGSYLWRLVQGDLGYSIYYNDSVAAILLRRLPWTLILVVVTLCAGTILGCAIGGISACFRNTWVDRILFLTMVAWAEMPAFLMGVILLFFFAAHLNLFPLAGGMTAFAAESNWGAKAVDLAWHAFLPMLAMILSRTPALYLLARSSMVTVMAKDYLRTARAKGLGTIRIFWRHALRNASLPIVTRLFMSLGSLLGSAVLVETLFSYPGVGLLMREAVVVHDYPLIQGIFLLVMVSVLSANFGADRVYRWLDPRIGDTNISLQSHSVPS